MSALRPELAPDSRRAMFGMTIFLVSLGIFFAALFILYFWLRSGLESWPPPGEPALPLGLPTANTVVVVLSSVVIQRAVRALAHAHPRRFSRLMLITANLGALFLVLQGLLFRQAIEMGITVGTSTYAGLLYTLAGVHAAHMLVGVAALVALGLVATRGATRRAALTRARMWAAFWHFLAGVWLVMYPAVFLF